MRIALIGMVSSLVACTADFSNFEATGDASADGPSIDGTSADGASDAVAADNGTVDTAATDSGAVDGGDVDSATVDTGTADTGTVDTGTAMEAGVVCKEPESKMLAGHCYFPIAPARWTQAASQCTSKGAHLVVITSAAEETLVESIRPGSDRWIGLSRMMGMPAVPDSYKWIDGEAKTYEKWGAGQPAGTGLCGKLTSANDWADEDCKQSFDAICERP